ncbi:MAG: hypothetical protein AUI14_07790 [Actinobacteria bacterium 13_2_20CM_2_71_6]|nr:MAG: hypothetical protein AUI14_07790 [Actinobacteria bacterium 13_2_20CM_2_71_6]
MACRLSSVYETRGSNLHAEALFVCDLQPSQRPAPEQVRRAVAAMLCRYGPRWCAARMAQEFGEHPETAVPRMVWAVQTVRQCYPVATHVQG